MGTVGFVDRVAVVAMAVSFAACGASPPSSAVVPASTPGAPTTTSEPATEPGAETSASAGGGEVSMQRSASPLPPPPKLAFEGTIVEGSLDAAATVKLLDLYGPQIGACVGDGANATATEIMLLVTDDKLSLRTVWRDGAPAQKLVDCLAPVMPRQDPSAQVAKRTDVYVVVTVTPDGATPAKVPAPPARTASFEDMFCKLDKLAGAEKLEPPKKQETMIAWARANVRHPAPFALAGSVGTWAPQDRDYNLKKALRAEGIKKCPMQRW